MSIRTLLKPLVPGFVVRMWRRHLTRQSRKAWEGRSAQEIFSTIYATNAWGGKTGEFNSGSGSTDAVTQPYVDAVLTYARNHGITSVLDIGCGDFRVGRQLVAGGMDYTGVDIVPALIEHHQQHYANERTRFICANAIEDTLPTAQLVLIRQVLQHLSNEAIAKVLAKLRSYPHVIVSEHYPAPSRPLHPNKDKPIGPDVRIMEDSAVVLSAPPFSLPQLELLLSVDADKHLIAVGETIKSHVWRPV